MKLDSFTRAYIQTALWSSTDDNSKPLDLNYSESDIASETLARMQADCVQFQVDNAGRLEAVDFICDASRAGHNFWLNRNGHGAGFWDEYYGDDSSLRGAFMNLSTAAKAFGSFDLYVGDDGQIHGQ